MTNSSIKEVPLRKTKSPLVFIKSFALFIAKFAVAALIIIWLINNHYHCFIRVIENIDASWLTGAALLFLALLLANSYRWYLLLKLQSIRINYFEAFSLSMQGFFFSLVIPGGALGGDLVKTGFLLARTPRGQKLKATSTIFMDRYLGMFGQFTLVIIMVAFSIPLIKEMDELTKLAVFIILLICITGILFGLAMLFHRKLEKIPPIGKCIRLADKLTKGLVSRLTSILDIYNKDKKTLAKGALISIFLVQVNMAVILCFVAYGIYFYRITLKSCLLGISLGNTAGLLPITPSGIGTRDAMVKSVLLSAGVPVGDAIAIPLLFSTLLLLFSLLGGLFFAFSKRQKKTKACFLDRDGVLIEEKNYISSPEQVRILPGTIEALKLLKDKNYIIIVVTNQAGVAKGYFPESSIAKIHAEIDRQLAAYDLKVDRYYYCPHHPDGTIKKYTKKCNCRKPMPGMILQAQKDFNLDLKKSFLVGDKITDLLAAKNAGCLGILVKTGYGHEYEHKSTEQGIPVYSDLKDAVQNALKIRISGVSSRI